MLLALWAFFCHLLLPRVEGSPGYGLFSTEGDPSSLQLVLRTHRP